MGDRTDAEIELAISEAVSRFGLSPDALLRLVKGDRHETGRGNVQSGHPSEPPEEDARYFGSDFKSSSRGVFARYLNDHGETEWKEVCKTPMYLIGLARDERSKNWEALVKLVDLDGRK